MPELPEVETVKNVLKNIVINRTIKSIDVLRRKTIQDDKGLFENDFKGETFLDITRKGKFLIFHLTNEKVFISHLRMEGKYYEVSEEDDNTKYAKIVFHLDNNHKLCYDDSRCFGIIIPTTENELNNVKDLAKLGPEPFDIKDVNYLIKKTKNKKLAIKTTLLDQSLMTGLGNIYVDETLYASNIHPWTPACFIKKEEWQRIVDNACKILNKAISMGGSTIKSYHPGKGIDGNFQTAIKIYGKEGETCPICGSTFRFTKTNGRGTTFCPHCQQKHGDNLTIAITGVAGSGKSTALKVFKDNGYPTLSSDEVVSELYNDPRVIDKLGKLLKINFPNNKMDKKLLRDHLVINPKDIKKVNSLIHPLVGKRIKDFLRDNSKGLTIVEVPLLFESGLDTLFDYIIAIGLTPTNQKKLLEGRNSATADAIMEINKNSKFEEYKNKASYLVYNDSDVSSYKEEIISIINKLKENLN